MVTTKYIMTGALCLSALMQGANSEKKNLVKGGEIQLSDCFDHKVALVSGSPETVYTPFMVTNTTEAGIFSRLFDRAISLCEGKIMRGYIGFITGDDQELNKQFASNVAEIIQPLLSQGHWDLFKNIDSGTAEDSALQKIVDGNIEKYSSIGHKKLSLCGEIIRNLYIERTLLFRSSHFSETKRPDRWLEAKAINGNVVFSPKESEYLKAAQHFGSVDECLAAITNCAKRSGGPVHEAPFLVLNLERYEAFLQQEFNKETH